MATPIPQLPELWRAQARAFDRYAPEIATVLRDKADEVECALLQVENRRLEAICRAEEFVLSSLSEGPRRKTVELRKAGRTAALSHAAIARALRALHARGDIAFEHGKRNARFWHIARSNENGA